MKIDQFNGDSSVEGVCFVEGGWIQIAKSKQTTNVPPRPMGVDCPKKRAGGSCAEQL